MRLDQIFLLMILIGGFMFIALGMCVANSIECRNSEKLSNILSIITAICGISFIIGIIGFSIY